jgi:hypothetical protein
MELWSGSLSEAITEVDSGALTGKLVHNFFNHHRCAPSQGEITSWENSIAELTSCSKVIPKKDIGLIIEYHLPYSLSRIDALLFGKNKKTNRNSAVLIELKQWSDAQLPDDDSLNVFVMNQEHLHPSQQAFDYKNHLQEIQSSIITCKIQIEPCAYCHNLSQKKETALDDSRFSQVLKDAPLFKKEQKEEFSDFLVERVGSGKGISIKDGFSNGRFKPNKKLLDVLDAVINQDEKWHLIDNQRLAYNSIWGKVLALKKPQSKIRNAAIIVKGAPGTGKSVIAVQLLADAMRNNFVAAHSTGGKAFSINLRSKFKGADKIFIWNMNLRNQPTHGLDLLLVDEAHRIRKTSNIQWTKSSDKTDLSQTEELLNAGRIVVFFLDDNQSVRPDEVGTTELILDTAMKMGIPTFTYDLQTQFRCGGCTEYLDWINNLFGFSSKDPVYWGGQYHFSLANSIDELESIIHNHKGSTEKNRLVAGFCWPWSDPNPDGSLVPDVIIDDWKRPWNAKAKKGYYPYEKHPYTLWAETQAGEEQIGCIYSAQGFDFDRVGVIWGKDLVWRDDNWIAQREFSKDNPVKSKKVNTEKYLKNSYRVLLTRGIKETRLLCLDDETRDHIRDCLENLKKS